MLAFLQQQPLSIQDKFSGLSKAAQERSDAASWVGIAAAVIAALAIGYFLWRRYRTSVAPRTGV